MYTREFFTDPIETKLRVLDHDRFEKLKDTYYNLRGWDVATGHPTPKKLKELGLGYIAKDMEKYIPKSRGMSDDSR